jgi:hypothetical protein
MAIVMGSLALQMTFNQEQPTEHEPSEEKINNSAHEGWQHRRKHFDGEENEKHKKKN